MYPSEKAFIMSFIASLAKKGENAIVLNDPNYNIGLENMHQYFQENRDNMGKYANELAMLFLKNSDGEYRQFNNAIENLNAGMLSFDNPFYISAHIQIDNNGADEILEENQEYISLEYIDGLATAFRGALP